MKRIKTTVFILMLFLLFSLGIVSICYGDGSISGTVSYSGSQTGTFLVAALDAPISCTGPNDANAVSIITVEPGDVSFPESYELSGLADGTYYVASAIKPCGTDCPMAFTDPWGIYNGCGSITPIVISGGNAETGIDITLVDGTVSNPNPFYDRTYDVEVVTSYSEGRYRVSFRVRDSDHSASSVSVAGPLITGSLDLVYNTVHNLWENSLILGTTKPVQPLTYTFTITDDVGPIIKETTLETTDYCEAFPTNISPSGGEEVRGTPVFTWDVLGPEYEYQIDVTDPSRQKIWSTGLVAGPPVMYEGPQLYFGLTYGYFFHTECSNGSYTIIEKNFVYMGPAITKAVSFTETFANHPTRPDGWYLHLLADVDDPAGVPGNIQSVTAVNLDTNIDSNIYNLNYSTGNTYKLHPDYTSQRETYTFTLENNQGQTAVLNAAPIDTPRQLNVIQNLAVSDDSTTPTVTFDTIADADRYRLSIFNENDLNNRIYRSGISDTPSFDVPAGVMTVGSTFYLRAEALDVNFDDGDGVDDLENRSLNYLEFTPGQSLSITHVYTYTETFANHPWGRSDGWYLHLTLGVDDIPGVPDNIESVTAVNPDTNIDPNTYSLVFSTIGDDAYYKHPAYTSQRGIYRFTVTNKQGDTAAASALPIDDPVQLGIIQNIQLSDGSTTPTVTFDTVDSAEKYRLTIFNSSPEKIYQSIRSNTPSFDVPAGIMNVGDTYYLRAEAHDINSNDSDGVNDLENRSLNYTAFTPVFNSQNCVYNLNLLADWNLISIPCQPSDTDIIPLLNSISGKYLSAWAYENGQWQFYAPGNPVSDLTAMVAGRGYWIYMTEAATLTIIGSTPSRTIPLNQSWNLVGYNSLTSQSIEDAMVSIAGKYISVWAFKNNLWEFYAPGNPVSDLTTMEPGYGYWINMSQPAAWTLP